MKARWIGSGLLGLAGLAALGCATAYPGAPGVGELSQHLTLAEDSGRQVRGQRPDDAPIQLAQAQVGPGQYGTPQVVQTQFTQQAAPVQQTAPAAPGLPPPIPLPTIPGIPGVTTIPTAPGSNGGLPIARRRTRRECCRRACRGRRGAFRSGPG